MPPRRKFPYIGAEVPEEAGMDIGLGDQWIDTNESPPVEKVCTSLDPVTWVILAQEYVLPETVLHSNPPSGYYKVINMFVNPTTGRTVVRYDDTIIL